VSRRLLRTSVIAACLILPSAAKTQVDPVWNSIIGSSLTEGRSYDILRRITDEAEGRLVGSAQNDRALTILAEELRSLGIDVRREAFAIPGWVRGDDEIVVTSPLSRKLRAVALGFTDVLPAFEDSVVLVGSGSEEEFRGTHARGKIALVTSKTPRGKEPLLRSEVISIAAAQGARAVCFVNDKEGGLVLCGVANFQGKPAPVPAFSLTLEEGSWIERLLQGGIPVRMRIVVRSHCMQMPTANLVATLPGSTGKTIVAGAHVDGWDIGQGAIDNGIGSAILFDVARLLKKYSGRNAYTVKLVWFNGEELGLWGSKEYVRAHEGDTIAAMVNMDMTGAPQGFNAGGFDEIVPLLSGVARKLGGFAMQEEPANSPGTNSDHEPFMLKGIPALSVFGHLDGDKVRYYHDFGDTFDKADRKGMAEASGVVAVLIRELANATGVTYARKSREEVIAMLKKGNIDERLKRQGEWPFDQ
jgi:hypothetical protein